MRLGKLPNGSFYIQKLKSNFSNPFIFRSNSKDTGKGGMILMNAGIQVPAELHGKKLMFKVEVVEE